MGKSTLIPVLTTLLLLAGCANYERLPAQELNETFTLSGISWSSGNSTVIMLKAFNSSGNLAVCGAYTGFSQRDVDMTLTREFFNRASVVIGDETIVSMNFVNVVPRYGLKIEKLFDRYVVIDAREPADCIRTEKPWKEDYGRNAIGYAGPERVRGRF